MPSNKFTIDFAVSFPPSIIVEATKSQTGNGKTNY